MTESEFLALADEVLSRIETRLEQITQATDIDIECTRNGNVLEVEFMHNRSKIIVNSQTPLQEMWVAAKSGGFHYKRDNDAWVNTRDGSELYRSLSVMFTEQSGEALTITAE